MVGKVKGWKCLRMRRIGSCIPGKTKGSMAATLRATQSYWRMCQNPTRQWGLDVSSCQSYDPFYTILYILVEQFSAHNDRSGLNNDDGQVLNTAEICARPHLTARPGTGVTMT